MQLPVLHVADRRQVFEVQEDAGHAAVDLNFLEELVTLEGRNRARPRFPWLSLGLGLELS